MRLLKDELKHFIKKKGIQKGLDAAAVIGAAAKVIDKVLPTTLQGEVKIESYAGGVLKLNVASGSPLSVINMYKQEILRQLKKDLGTSRVERIIIRSSRVYLD